MFPTKFLSIDLLSNAALQQVASWSAFNAVAFHIKPCITEIGYCPMITASPAEYSVVYTVMKQVQFMMAILGNQYSVIMFDLAIYVKAKEIQQRNHNEFSNIVIRLGGFHIALNYLAVLGKCFQDSGIEDLLIESGLYGPSSASALLYGKLYN